MSLNDLITSVLYRLYSGEVISGMYVLPEKEALDEAERMGLIKNSFTKYDLTFTGKTLVREQRTYDDFLQDRLPPTPKNTSKTAPVITEISLNDYAIINAHRANQLRDAALLDDNLPLANPAIPQITPHSTNPQTGIGLKRKSLIVVKNITKNDYFKFIIIGIIVGLIVAYFVFIFKWNK
jgi:hypothetical protein